MEIDEGESGFGTEFFRDEVSEFMPDVETGSAGRAGAGKHAPVLVISRTNYKKLTLSIKSGTHETLTKYLSYYQQVGGLKPEEGEVVDAALQRAFDEDKGFQTYLASGGGARESRRQQTSNDGVGKEVIGNK